MYSNLDLLHKLRRYLMWLADAEIENTGAYDKTQSQTGSQNGTPPYGVDQSSYGVMDASQSYYQVCIFQCGI